MTSTSNLPAGTQPLDANAEKLAGALATAFSSGQRIDSRTLTPPADAATAFSVQHRILTLTGNVAGAWKTGAKTPGGPKAGAPLPGSRLYRGNASIAREMVWPCAVEIEIAFRFNRTFDAWAEPDDATVMDAIDGMAVAVELVASRYTDFPHVDPMLALADLQCHGALVVGKFVPYEADFPFVAPDVQFTVGALDVMAAVADKLPGGVASNTAGDPRTLLGWLVQRSCKAGIAVTPETIVTTGSYCAMLVLKEGGAVQAQIAGLEPLTFTLL